MAVIVELADAVVQALNNALFSQPIQAQRLHLPRFELPELAELHVSVVPRSASVKTLDRSRSTIDYQIDVAVQQKTDGTDQSVSNLLALVEEILDHFRTNHLADSPEARCVEVQNEPVYSAEHLHEFGQFTSIVTLTFRVWK